MIAWLLLICWLIVIIHVNLVMYLTVDDDQEIASIKKVVG